MYCKLQHFRNFEKSKSQLPIGLFSSRFPKHEIRIGKPHTRQSEQKANAIPHLQFSYRILQIADASWKETESRNDLRISKARMYCKLQHFVDRHVRMYCKLQYILDAAAKFRRGLKSSGRNFALCKNQKKFSKRALSATRFLIENHWFGILFWNFKKY